MSVRRTTTDDDRPAVAIRLLSDGKEAVLTGDEWLELCSLIHAIDVAVRFETQATPVGVRYG